MFPQFDLAVYTPDHDLLLVVEIKGTSKSDEFWAAKFRRNLLTHDAIPTSPYFLLVVSDRLYLWENETSDEAISPSYSADTKSVLGRYLPKLKQKIHGEKISEQGLELAVRSWLSDLANAENPPEDVSLKGLLHDSGLAAKIRAAEIRSGEYV